MSGANLLNEPEKNKQEYLGAILQSISPQYLEDMTKTEEAGPLSHGSLEYTILTTPNTVNPGIHIEHLEEFAKKNK